MSIPNFELSAPFVNNGLIIPNKWEEARLILTDYVRLLAAAVNARELALYPDSTIVGGANIAEIPTGQTWFVSGDANQFRYGQRTVVNVTAGLQDYSGGITTQTAAHGIAVTANTTFTRIFGVANDPGTSALPLPFVDADAVGNGIEISVDATNVNLRYAADYSAYAVVYIVLEYIEGT